MNDIDTVVERFREAGMKITPQRLSIFALLMDNKDHPSAENIYHQVLEIHPSISFTTVYKTLQTLRDLGEINELSVDPERAHYDPDVSEHYHAFCRSCRGIRDIFPGESSSFSSELPELEGFRVQSVQVAFTGQCEECS
ncbi:MAG: transcriptional repressor [bacterium]|nr:MAG: transcriptional repressor [bacterium]